MSNKSDMEQRIDNAIYGTPKIKPDEQRKYLGTFREIGRASCRERV